MPQRFFYRQQCRKSKVFFNSRIASTFRRFKSTISPSSTWIFYAEGFSIFFDFNFCPSNRSPFSLTLRFFLTTVGKRWLKVGKSGRKFAVIFSYRIKGAQCFAVGHLSVWTTRVDSRCLRNTGRDLCPSALVI